MSTPSSNSEGSVTLRRLLTLEQVAEQLGVSKAWVRDHATRRNPRIPVVRLGGRRALLRFRPEDVKSFIEQHLEGEESFAGCPGLMGGVE